MEKAAVSIPDEDELLGQAAASLRLEDFDTSPERLKELRQKADRKTDGPPRERRQVFSRAEI